MANLVVIILEIIITATSVGWDHSVQQAQRDVPAQESEMERKTRYGLQRDIKVFKNQRRWNVGMGTLLWEIEHHLMQQKIEITNPGHSSKALHT